MTKRILWSCVMLVLGLFTTVAMAWACAAWVDPGQATTQFSTAPVDDGLSEVTSTQVRFGHARINRCIANTKPYEPGDVYAIDVIRGRNERSETLAGWPMRALACTNPADVRIVNPGRFANMWWNRGVDLMHGIALAPFAPGATVGGPSWRALPYQPLWIGLIVNTLIFAAAWSALLIGPGLAHRALRRRRGLCERCGYDLRNVAHERCPECGHAVRRRAMAASHA